MSAWTDERNRNIRILQALMVDTPERKAAIEWAVRKLEGAPEDWVDVGVAIDFGMDADAYHKATSHPTVITHEALEEIRERLGRVSLMGGPYNAQQIFDDARDLLVMIDDQKETAEAIKSGIAHLHDEIANMSGAHIDLHNYRYQCSPVIKNYIEHLEKQLVDLVNEMNNGSYTDTVENVRAGFTPLELGTDNGKT